MTGRVIVVGGGVRSGKSAFALARARQLGARRGFVATAQAFDDEMAARIADHVRTRGPDFQTFEEPIALAARLAGLRELDVVVVDCLTLWLSNLLVADQSAAAIEAEIDELVGVVAARPFHTILVTNEVGMGIVPESALGRAFRDLAGRAHQRLAAVAGELYLAALGVIVRLRPDPIAVQSPGGP
ncbi:MAG TPA: bifunctional adenosylcobinamide kinase/adenosylcobinamide-phosphate guanylyltransferase [Kofleriaceae bacterium]|jgi:adenosylcobinamide kinase/adenosylcobinamide-phosphate guanylyltransferase|nr:bifunctional adenosylcobinamide kinase/adenosylcobinamide-phosphate guanylyltransferase [Kofleriaceae bacterium]